MSDRRYDWHEVSRFDPYEITLQTALSETALLHAIAEQMKYNPFLRLSEFDQCECILRRIFAAIDHFIKAPSDVEAAIAIVRDGKQNNCLACTEREKQKQAAVADELNAIRAVERGG